MVQIDNAFSAWLRSEPYSPKRSNVTTDGITIFSYQTAILTTNSGGVVKLNMTKYSFSTTRHQNEIAAKLLKAKIEPQVVYNVPMGARDF